PAGEAAGQDGVFAVEEFGAEAGVVAEVEYRLAEGADLVGRQAVGEVGGHGLAAGLVGLAGAVLAESLGDGVVGQGRVALLVLQFIDDEFHRLRQFGRALGVVAAAAAIDRAAQAVAVSETGTNGLEEDAMRAAARVET